MNKFPISYIHKKYSPIQKKICSKQDGLIPSDTVLFGLGDARWSKFERNGAYNRVCLSLEYDKDILRTTNNVQ